jgi:hypothetical protein
MDATPAPAPEPAPEPQNETMPKTASDLALIGLIGFGAAFAAFGVRQYRRGLH